LLEEVVSVLSIVLREFVVQVEAATDTALSYHVAEQGARGSLWSILVPKVDSEGPVTRIVEVSIVVGLRKFVYGTLSRFPTFGCRLF